MTVHVQFVDVPPGSGWVELGVVLRFLASVALLAARRVDWRCGFVCRWILPRGAGWAVSSASFVATKTTWGTCDGCHSGGVGIDCERRK